MTKRPPLLSDEECEAIADLTGNKYFAAIDVRDHYEAARAKDAELIQRLIQEGDAMAALIEVNEHFIQDETRRSHWHSHRIAWEAAKTAASAGFTPTEQP